MELTDYQAQYEQTCVELRRVKESVEIDKYRALDEERIKWERREATLYTQLERARITASGASIGMQPPPLGTTLARVLSPMVSRTSSRRLPRIPDATSSAVRSTSLSVTAPDFSPAFTACPSIGGITPLVYTSPRLAVTFGGSMFVCSSSSYAFTTTSTPMRSSPSMDLPLSATTVYFQIYLCLYNWTKR